MLKQFLQDANGTYSSSRLVNVSVCAAAIVVTLLLTWNGTMTEGYFAALLAYGAGVQSWGKYVEAKSNTEQK